MFYTIDCYQYSYLRAFTDGIVILCVPIYRGFLVVCSVLYFFFFQAEDGIRDYKVTGVQTCALPISSGPRGGTCGKTVSKYRCYNNRICSKKFRTALWSRSRVVRHKLSNYSVKRPRSEERRVGKEGRSRWSPYH